MAGRSIARGLAALQVSEVADGEKKRERVLVRKNIEDGVYY